MYNFIRDTDRHSDKNKQYIEIIRKSLTTFANVDNLYYEGLHAVHCHRRICYVHFHTPSNRPFAVLNVTARPSRATVPIIIVLSFIIRYTLYRPHIQSMNTMVHNMEHATITNTG